MWRTLLAAVGPAPALPPPALVGEPEKGDSVRGQVAKLTRSDLSWWQEVTNRAVQSRQISMLESVSFGSGECLAPGTAR